MEIEEKKYLEAVKNGNTLSPKKNKVLCDYFYKQSAWEAIFKDLPKEYSHDLKERYGNQIDVE